MADVLTVVAKIRAAKGKGDALAALLKEQVAVVMKAEPGCLVYRPHRSTKDPDVFVFYDNVQFTTTRSFFARVQLKTATGRRWLTVPVHKSGRYGQRIDETEIVDDGWAARHGTAMRAAFAGAPFAATIEPLLATLTGRTWERLADLTVTTTMQMVELFGFRPRTLRASAMDIGGSGTERLLAICRSLGATGYLTGHGALDCSGLERDEPEGDHRDDSRDQQPTHCVHSLRETCGSFVEGRRPARRSSGA